MLAERTVPVLACRDIDDVVPFYLALGFAVTYRQARPNPYVCLNRGGLDLHFMGIEQYEPENSLGNVLVVVPSSRALHEAFSEGLRAAFGKVPVTGIPRMTRPRRKQGAGGGFTVVDPGGNWLRVSSTGSSDDDESEAPTTGLAKVLETAARQGDARGDEAQAIAVLRAGLERHAGALPGDRLAALVYLAELLIRTGDSAGAASVLDEADALELTAAERELRAYDLAAASEMRQQLTAESS